MSDDPEFAYLTTAGRVTGAPHRIEIWYRRLGEVVWFISGGKEMADWVKNLRADPRCTVEIGEDGPPLAGTAFFDAQDEMAPRESLAARYQRWAPGAQLTRWATEGLLVGVRLD